MNVAFFVLVIATAVGARAQTAMWDLPQGGFADWGLLIGIGRYTDGSLHGVAMDEWWRIVTGGFLHAGLLHLGMNMLVLWIIGAQLEKAIGPVRYACLYFTSLLAGALGVLLIDPTTPTVGASGAVFGLMGAALIYQRSRGHRRVAIGAGHADPLEPRLHVPDPRHLEGRSHRWSRGRCARRHR